MLALGKTIIAVLYRLKRVNQLALPLHYLNHWRPVHPKVVYILVYKMYLPQCSMKYVYSTELRRLTVHLLWAIECSTRGPRGIYILYIWFSYFRSNIGSVAAICSKVTLATSYCPVRLLYSTYYVVDLICLMLVIVESRWLKTPEIFNNPFFIIYNLISC